jgi:peptidyl-dipeptidase A
MVMGTTAAATAADAGPTEDNDARAKRFVQRHETTVRPLEIEVAHRWWDANLSGRDEDYQKKKEAETKLDLLLAEPAPFAELKAIRQKPIRDPVLARQIELLHLQYLPKQLDPELLKKMLAKSNGIEQAFNVHRAKLNGKDLSDNDLREILRNSKDSARRRAAWEASKDVGAVVEKDLNELVKLRN